MHPGWAMKTLSDCREQGGIWVDCSSPSRPTSLSSDLAPLSSEGVRKPFRHRLLGGVLALAAAVACGGQPTAGPSPVAVAPPPTTAPAPTPRPVPAWIDPALVGTLLKLDPEGWPQRWDGGPFHHCFGGVTADELATAQAVAQRMTDLTGIPRTEAGPCNVTWESEKIPGHTTAYPGGTARSIFSARIVLRTVYPESEALMLHEAGHVLGLGHSPKPSHLMNATPRALDFTPEELAVLAWMYPRK